MVSHPIKRFSFDRQDKRNTPSGRYHGWSWRRTSRSSDSGNEGDQRYALIREPPRSKPFYKISSLSLLSRRTLPAIGLER